MPNIESGNQKRRRQLCQLMAINVCSYLITLALLMNSFGIHITNENVSLFASFFSARKNPSSNTCPNTCRRDYIPQSQVRPELTNYGLMKLNYRTKRNTKYGSNTLSAKNMSKYSGTSTFLSYTQFYRVKGGGGSERLPQI